MSRAWTLVAVAAAATLLLLCSAALRTVDAARPSHPDEVFNLPGVNFDLKFRHYSGYLPLPNSPTRLHYWFVESQNDPATDPVILWLNGGPGCSSMLGMLTENGPFRLQSDGATLDLNPDSWNKIASVLYLESPSGVGFSYGTTNNYTSGDASTAADNYAALQYFFAEYKEFSTQRFYAMGESYAGNYVPELVQVIIHANRALGGAGGDAIPINLQGMACGNPTMGGPFGANAYLPMMASHALISAADYAKVTQLCQGQFEPPLNGDCGKMVSQLLLQTYDINPYNIEAKCEGAGWGSQPGCFTMDALSESVRPSGRLHSPRAAFPSDPAVGRPLSQTFVPCIDLTPIRTYLNNHAVMDALHIAVNEVILPWDACSQVLHYSDIVGEMTPIYEDIFANSSIRVLVYSGDVDSCVAYLGTEQTVAAFPYAQRTPLKDAWQSWHYVSRDASSIQQVGGKFMQWAERLAYATVRGAGHMVPHDRSEAALQLLNSFLNDPTAMRFN